MNFKITLVDGSQGGASIELTNLSLNFQGGAFANIPVELMIAENSIGNFNIEGKQVTNIAGLKPIESQMAAFNVRTAELKTVIDGMEDGEEKEALKAKLIVSEKFNLDVEKAITQYNKAIQAALTSLLVTNFTNEKTQA